MTGVRVREAEVRDLDAIMALESTTFTTDAWSREMMAAELAAPHTRYIVALDTGAQGDGAIIGYAGLSAPRGASQADIQTIAVAAEYRRRGIGAQLLRHLLDEAVARGVDDVLLEVRADNPGAQHLYETHGFTPIAVRPRYYQPDGVDAIVMRWEASP